MLDTVGREGWLSTCSSIRDHVCANNIKFHLGLLQWIKRMVVEEVPPRTKECYSLVGCVAKEQTLPLHYATPHRREAGTTSLPTYSVNACWSLLQSEGT